MEKWFIELVLGFYEQLYESMVYGISYDFYEWFYQSMKWNQPFAFMNGCADGYYME